MTVRRKFRGARLASALLAAACALCAAQARNDATQISVEYQNPIHNQNFPELVYWFVTPQTLAPAQYKKDIQHIAHDTMFKFPE
jgi:hypothetical protein